MEVDLAAPVKPSDGCGSAKIFVAASRESWSPEYQGQPLLSAEPWKSFIKYTLNVDEENKVGGKLTVWFRSLLSLLGEPT